MNKLSQLQKQYDAMKAIAQSSMNANVSFDNSFQKNNMPNPIGKKMHRHNNLSELF